MMELTAQVIEIKGKKALVRQETLEEEPAPKPFITDNRAGAEQGDRVKVFVPDFMEGAAAMVYLAPLAGVIGGAVAGRLVGAIEAVHDALLSAGGKLIGPTISKADNLAFFGGLAGLVLSVIVLWRWIGKRKAEAHSSSYITEVLKD